MGKPGPSNSRELRASDFDPKEKVWTKFPPEGSKHTPPHQSVEFRWKDYCPLVFRFASICLILHIPISCHCGEGFFCFVNQSGPNVQYRVPLSNRAGIFCFRYLRRLFKVDAADYMLSICGNDALRELSSPGKSGSFFYLTHDDRYMIKTMKKSEMKVCIVCPAQ